MCNLIIVSNEDIHPPLSLQYVCVERGTILGVHHLVRFRVMVSDTDKGIFQVFVPQEHNC